MDVFTQYHPPTGRRGRNKSISHGRLLKLNKTTTKKAQLFITCSPILCYLECQNYCGNKVAATVS